jgi:hypothetical protein
MLLLILDGLGEVAGLPVQETVADFPVAHEPDAGPPIGELVGGLEPEIFSWTANHRAAV